MADEGKTESNDMYFNFKPGLTGELIELRPLEKSDFEDLFCVAKDPLIWEQHPANDRYKKSKFIEFFSEAIDANSALVAIDRKSRNIIGSSRYHGYSAEKSEIEIGWSFLAKLYWGGEYNGEMKRLMLNHAFQYVKNVILIIDVDNLRSQRAAEKIGGVLSSTKIQRGNSENVMYRITQSGFMGK